MKQIKKERKKEREREKKRSRKKEIKKKKRTEKIGLWVGGWVGVSQSWFKELLSAVQKYDSAILVLRKQIWHLMFIVH